MKTDPRLQRAAMEAVRLYGDIIDRDPPEPDPVKHPRLSMEQRAAQFLPFSALKGYDEAVDEKARLTVDKPELDEDQKQELDRAFAILSEKKDTEAEITYYRKDDRKKGGDICLFTGTIRKADLYARRLILSDNNHIDLDDILGIRIL